MVLLLVALVSTLSLFLSKSLSKCTLILTKSFLHFIAFENNQGGAARYGNGNSAAAGELGPSGPQNGHGANNGGGGPGSRRSSRRDDRYHPYR